MERFISLAIFGGQKVGVDFCWTYVLPMNHGLYKKVLIKELCNAQEEIELFKAEVKLKNIIINNLVEEFEYIKQETNWRPDE